LIKTLINLSKAPLPGIKNFISVRNMLSNLDQVFSIVVVKYHNLGFLWDKSFFSQKLLAWKNTVSNSLISSFS